MRHGQVVGEESPLGERPADDEPGRRPHGQARRELRSPVGVARAGAGQGARGDGGGKRDALMLGAEARLHTRVVPERRRQRHAAGVARRADRIRRAATRPTARRSVRRRWTARRRCAARSGTARPADSRSARCRWRRCGARRRQTPAGYARPGCRRAGPSRAARARRRQTAARSTDRRWCRLRRAVRSPARCAPPAGTTPSRQGATAAGRCVRSRCS